MESMWILFFIIVTSPGHFEAVVLDTYQTPTAEADCNKTKEYVIKNMKKQYSSDNEIDSFGALCLKQKEKEA